MWLFLKYEARTFFLFYRWEILGNLYKKHTYYYQHISLTINKLQYFYILNVNTYTFYYMYAEFLHYIGENMALGNIGVILNTKVFSLINGQWQYHKLLCLCGGLCRSAKCIIVWINIMFGNFRQVSFKYFYSLLKAIYYDSNYS